ncbi:uncharacterized protein LOC107370388 [Tetranychus urticae]|uniref:Exportin-1/Importin-beta-like domain-containing protein n=1 Tax=Tetranychus urticae TaxID=32264 RepID=T1JTS8_TETUR|nr:uncharacterized protein LOC107370388 [Tetranychus urticae]
MNVPDPSRDIPYLFHTCMLQIATEFKSNQSQRKFDLCNQLAAIIQESDKSLLSQIQPCSPSISTSSTSSSSTSTEVSAANWLPLLTSGLYDIFTSRLDKQNRDSGFYLIAALNEVFPRFNWMTIGTEGVTDTHCKNFFPLIGRLVCIEICIELRKDEAIDEHLLNACLMIFETFIDTLCTEEKLSQPASRLSPDSIVNLYNALRETILTVIDYVKNIIYDWESVQSNEKNFSIVMACVRVICFWSLEDFKGIEDKVTDLIPFFNQLLKDEKSAKLVGHFILASFEELFDGEETQNVQTTQ